MRKYIFEYYVPNLNRFKRYVIIGKINFEIKMRVKEPLNGFLSSLGYTNFHIALLLGSYCIMHDRPKSKTLTDVQLQECIEADMIISMVRQVHAFVIVAQVLRTLLYSPENRLIC